MRIILKGMRVSSAKGCERESTLCQKFMMLIEGVANVFDNTQKNVTISKYGKIFRGRFAKNKGLLW